MGFGFRVQGIGFRVLGFWFWLLGFGFWLLGFGEDVRDTDIQVHVLYNAILKQRMDHEVTVLFSDIAKLWSLG